MLAVTKGFGVGAIVAALAAGFGRIGENYAQEVVAKLSSPDRPFGVRFIGQLQTLLGYTGEPEMVHRDNLILMLR